jgi:hypothetical protein
MDLNKFTTEELQELSDNFGAIKKELKARKDKKNEAIKLKVGDVYFRDYGDSTFIYKIDKVGNRYTNCYEICLNKEQIEIYDRAYEFENSNIKTDIALGNWHKIDKDIFDNIFNLCEEYTKKVNTLHDELYKNCMTHFNNR